MIIGLDQFSFHRFYGDVFPGERDAGERWTLDDFLVRARALEIGLVGLHTHYLTSADTAQLGKLDIEVILEWGHPDGLQMGTNPARLEELRHWLNVVADAGIGMLRIVAGYPNWRGREPVAHQIARLVPWLRDLATLAVRRDVLLAIENHADFTPAELVDLVEQVNHPALRICFDTGNCVRLGADLLKSARLVAPWTALVHLKDLRSLASSRGKPEAAWPSAPLGEGTFDLTTVITTLQAGGFDGPWLIELAALHADSPDEQTAVERSLAWLRTQERSHVPTR